MTTKNIDREWEKYIFHESNGMKDVGSMVEVDYESLLAAVKPVIELVLRKNADYGDAWQQYGYIGAMIRGMDKCLRLQNLDGRESLVVDETIGDTLRDNLGYAMLALLRYNHMHGV